MRGYPDPVPLRRIDLHLTGARVMSVNDMLRSSDHKRADARDHLLGKLSYELARTRQRPTTPLRYVEIDITLHVVTPLDVDGKYAAVKHLLDCLTRPKSNLALLRQQARQRRGLFVPLGVIHDDTDGEHGLPGCVRRLTIRQVPAPHPAIALTLQEVTP